MFRQGDVLIIPCKVDVQGLQKVEREDGDVVLAHGEATGHKHRILHVREVSKKAGEVSHQIAQLLHQEHGTIEVPTGTYQVIRQREYTPEAIRYVAD